MSDEMVVPNREALDNLIRAAMKRGGVTGRLLDEAATEVRLALLPTFTTADAYREQIARVEAELDYAEDHHRHVANDEVLVEVGLIRFALTPKGPADE